jgi:cytochrome c5
MKKITAFGFLLSGAIALSSCYSGDKTEPGLEYAPDMYESQAYEPYKQVDANTINPTHSNMRNTPEHTVSRVNGVSGSLPIELMNDYPIGKDSLDYAASILRNPVAKTEKNLADGKYLYTTYCSHCHGAEGDGNGLVGKVYAGVPNYKSSTLANVPSGHIYHVITKGKGRMWAHGSQIRPEDRWKIVHYVNQLRGYEDK